MSLKIQFEKVVLTVRDQLYLLKSRNLIIHNDSEVELCLSTIGYYRLTSYFKLFLLDHKNSDDGFKQNIQFLDVLQLYVFDRELRLLVTDALERIEVALRTAISNIMSVKYDTHWYMNQDLFLSQMQHNIFLNEISDHLKRTKEDFIQKYYDTYYSPEYPPSWMVIECLSFGTISKIYSNLKDRSARKQIADVFGQYSEIVKSWMKSLTYTRNLCAHHSRLWNRFFINKPKGVHVKYMHSSNASPFSMQAYMIIKLLNKISPSHHWKQRLFKLFENYPSVPFGEMGFCNDWKSDPIWDL
ncbi:MAG: Abi family protein [Proteobacteria bacterium]|nr:Abi family protein [Pseudomonadota bacterium]